MFDLTHRTEMDGWTLDQTTGCLKPTKYNILNISTL